MPPKGGKKTRAVIMTMAVRAFFAERQKVRLSRIRRRVKSAEAKALQASPCVRNDKLGELMAPDGKNLGRFPSLQDTSLLLWKMIGKY